MVASNCNGAVSDARNGPYENGRVRVGKVKHRRKSAAGNDGVATCARKLPGLAAEYTIGILVRDGVYNGDV